MQQGSHGFEVHVHEWEYSGYCTALASTFGRCGRRPPQKCAIADTQRSDGIGASGCSGRSANAFQVSTPSFIQTYWKKR